MDKEKNLKQAGLRRAEIRSSGLLPFVFPDLFPRLFLLVRLDGDDQVLDVVVRVLGGDLLVHDLVIALPQVAFHNGHGTHAPNTFEDEQALEQ
ncbi:MAG: hypothetical protein JNM76_04140 [Betaproteobacteria bacterium]|nr:hypothetical protein [Betaproteobacteria bacterium]